jgi:hypothetical protein
MTDTALDFGGLEGASPAGVGKVYADGEGPRITWIHSMGVGHAWPSGSGVSSGGLTFVSGNGMNFSYYLAEFFTANARRADGDWNPGDDDGGSEGGGEGGGSEGGEGTDGGGMTSGGPGDDDGNGEGADEGAAQTGDDGDGTAGSGPGADQPEHIDPSGCQCRAQARSGSALGLGGWLVLMLGAWRRRKRS